MKPIQSALRCNLQAKPYDLLISIARLGNPKLENLKSVIWLTKKHKMIDFKPEAVPGGNEMSKKCSKIKGKPNTLKLLSNERVG